MSRTQLGLAPLLDYGGKHKRFMVTLKSAVFMRILSPLRLQARALARTDDYRAV